MPNISLKKLLVKIIKQTSPIGAVQMFAGDNPPNGWLLCDGRSLLIADYPELAAVLRDNVYDKYLYGAVDDTHFNLPNFHGRVPLGSDQDEMSYWTGKTGGTESVTLTENQLPQITGSFFIRHWATSTSNAIFSTTGKFTSANVSADANNIGNNSSNPKNAQRITYAFGGGGSHTNMMPYLSINYIIYTGKTS